MTIRVHYFIMLAFTSILAGCANITTPTGGKKDTTPPKLIKVLPVDSLTNSRFKKLELNFDEYIILSDASKEVKISPLLPIDPTVISAYKKVTVKLVDTLLDSNTTYTISFGNAIKDLHENNVFKNYIYRFSTGSYFDSLTLKGRIIRANSGTPDTTKIIVGLYDAKESDSAVVKHKPKYVVVPNSSGGFLFTGLPKRDFKIFAIRDQNDNLIFDGPGEGLAFSDKLVSPGDTTGGMAELYMYDLPDTAQKTGSDGIQPDKKEAPATKADLPFNYTTNIDTVNKNKRTFSYRQLNKRMPIQLKFTQEPVIVKEKITLQIDSAESHTSVLFQLTVDSINKNCVNILPDWGPGKKYTLKLAKGFAKDTSGKEAQPAKFSFQVKENDDYGKLTVHLPAKYNNGDFVLIAMNDKDTVYNQKVTDTLVAMPFLNQGRYYFKVLEDKNHNGTWDPGDLFKHSQPEIVTQSTAGGTPLKPGWDNTIDFEKKQIPAKKGQK